MYTYVAFIQVIQQQNIYFNNITAKSDYLKEKLCLSILYLRKLSVFYNVAHFCN
jgi:hypothetical protein